MKHTYWVILFPGGKIVQLKKLDYEKAIQSGFDVTVETPGVDYKIIGNKRVFSLGVNHFLVADAKKQIK